MTSVVRTLCTFQPSFQCVLWSAALLLAFSGAIMAEEAELDFDPSEVPTVKWLPKANPIPEAEAADEAGMKTYTETIPGTELEFDMLPIPAGTFLLGSPDDEDDRQDDEGPQVEVAVEPFWMAKCEVTWDEYETWSFKLDVQRRNVLKEEATHWDKWADAITRPTSPYSDMTFGMGHDGYPAICMTQIAAKMYCKWLGAKTGRFYRLPTEAEWEYACRAGTTTPYSFGGDVDDLEDYAWYFDNSDDGYQKVGKLKPNPWGLHDMHGNVCEWVLDQHTADAYKTFAASGTPAKNPLVSPKALYPRVVRGGSWDHDPEDCRSARRFGSEEDWKMQDPQIPQSIWYHTDATFVGFRVIRPLKVPTEEDCKLYEPDTEAINEYKEAQGGKM